MTPPSAHQRYLADAVETVSPPRLLVMLYDRLLRDLVEARTALEGGDCEVANRALLHAQEIVVELMASLDPDQWEHAPQMERIYAFLLEELVQANTGKDVARVSGCAAVVQPLRDTWHEAALIVAQGAEGAPSWATSGSR
ncbi:MAG: flagellar export chaperone FliS [Acidimicrobiia bacterium]|nr:flagellar export chaperone FliS [Acidimicrobiia bacterium]